MFQDLSVNQWGHYWAHTEQSRAQHPHVIRNSSPVNVFISHKPNTATGISVQKCKWDRSPQITPAFHRSQTPCCIYPKSPALSLPASLHFCYLRGTSSLSLSEHCLSWRVSIHLEGKRQMLRKTQNEQPKKQQLFDFIQTLAAFAEIP